MAQKGTPGVVLASDLAGTRESWQERGTAIKETLGKAEKQVIGSIVASVTSS